MQVSVGWSEDMRFLGRSRLNYESSTTVYLKQMEWRTLNRMIWMKVECHWQSVVKKVKNLRVPKKLGNFFH